MPLSQLVPTNGTKTSIWLNLLGGVLTALAAVSWAPLGQAGTWVASGILIINAALHAVTGNAPVVGTPATPPA